MPNAHEDAANEVLPGTARVDGDAEATESRMEATNIGYRGNAMEITQEGLSNFAIGVPFLLKMLDEVAKVHPFITIAVNAFRVVFELQIKLLDNDKKIGVLFAEMGETVGTLLQLRQIQDGGSIGPDGLTIKTRLEELIRQTAEDIKACANACDTYAKKKLLLKVIQGPVWEGTLKGFIDLFASRRKAFMFALSFHIGAGILNVHRGLKEIDAKVDAVLDFFSKVMSPGQQELIPLVHKKGGAMVVMGDDDALRELLQFRPATVIDQANRHSGRDNTELDSRLDGDDWAMVKQELFESPILAIKRNLDVFERKFRIQERLLLEEWRRTVLRREGDRVIQAITAGPRDRILDPDIHRIWTDMRWLEYAKAPHFVLTLCDYYRRDLERECDTSHSDAAVSLVCDQDEWALQWINVNRLQAIVEAFDEEASGFITIAKVNRFAASRPNEWSLPHWLAYWAIGWQMAATKYRDMIVDICAKMFAIRPHIHPANRNAVNMYLQTLWQRICTLTSSFVDTYQAESLQEQFKVYVDAEEQRLREGLETIGYHIDTMDTLLLVTGPGRIEKYLFPLLWLLLCRDFEIVRQCQNIVIHKDELWDSADTIVWVFDAITQRHDDLEASFRQQKLDPGPQFKVFASELYHYWHDSEKFWSLDNLRMLEFPEVEYDDAEEDQTVDVGTLLKYPSAADVLYALPEEDAITWRDAVAEEAICKILGRWNGIQILENDAISSMITFYLHASTDRPSAYEASSVGTNGTACEILGHYTTTDNGTVEYSFTQIYVARLKKTYWTGTLEDDGETLTGKWGYAEDNQPCTFIFKRVPPEVLVDRPHPKEFTEDRVKALWKYALTAVRNQVRRNLFSWSYLKTRRDMRKEYLELLLKDADDRLTDMDMERLSRLNHRLTFDDVRCFYIIHDYRLRTVPTHFGVVCNYCQDAIYNTRVVCLECGTRLTFNFCDKPACVGSTIRTRDDTSLPHLPTHDFVKVRAPIVHYHDIGKVLRDAKAGLGRAKKLLEELEDQKRRYEFMKREDEGLRAGERRTAGSGGSEHRQAYSEELNVVATLACLRCNATVSEPCFYCMDCPEDTDPFVCWDCDKQLAGFDHGEHHLATHNLVRCIEARRVEELKPARHRAGAAEQVDPLEDRFKGLTSEMMGLKSQLERMEKLLQSLPQVHVD